MPRSYTPQQRSDCLATYDSLHNASQAAKAHGLPVGTLRRWLKDRDAAAPQDMREASKRDLLAELNSARFQYLDRLKEDQAVRTTSGYYAARTFETLNQAHQLLSGGPTQRFSLADYLRGAMKPVAPAAEGQFTVTQVPSETGGST